MENIDWFVERITCDDLALQLSVVSMGIEGIDQQIIPISVFEKIIDCFEPGGCPAGIFLIQARHSTASSANIFKVI